jgi:hypothetical protein
MSYRDAETALKARRERIASDLSQARAALREATERAAQADALEHELAELDRVIASGAARRGLPVLDDVKIASPCSARWEEMTGDDRVRFCGQCQKNVYDLSAMPRAEAEGLLAATEGNLCARIYRRADGKVLTADCPVGKGRRRRRRIAAAAVAGGVLAAASSFVSSASRTMGEVRYDPPSVQPPVATMGAVAPRLTTKATATAEPEAVPIDPTDHGPHADPSPAPPHPPVRLMGKVRMPVTR